MYCPRCSIKLHVHSDIYELDTKVYTCIKCGYENVRKPTKLQVLLSVADTGNDWDPITRRRR